jgi:hypothetical protein
VRRGTGCEKEQGLVLNEYEKSFVLKMGRLKTTGIDFQGLAKEALDGKFGGATDVILRGLSADALREPERFVSELTRIFGRGAMGFCDPIIRYVDLGLYSPAQNTSMLGILNQLGPPKEGESDPNRTPLHEHRIKDEEGNYSDEAN